MIKKLNKHELVRAIGVSNLFSLIKSMIVGVQNEVSNDLPKEIPLSYISLHTISNHDKFKCMKIEIYFKINSDGKVDLMHIGEAEISDEDMPDEFLDMTLDPNKIVSKFINRN